MADETNDSGDPTAPHPLALKLDIVDWRRAGEFFLSWTGQLEANVPPLDRGRAAELSFLIREADIQFERWVELWRTVIRPGLKKYEGVEAPPGTFL